MIGDRAPISDRHAVKKIWLAESARMWVCEECTSPESDVRASMTCDDDEQQPPAHGTGDDARQLLRLWAMFDQDDLSVNRAWPMHARDCFDRLVDDMSSARFLG